jgi:hypothetical protein
VTQLFSRNLIIRTLVHHLEETLRKAQQLDLGIDEADDDVREIREIIEEANAILEKPTALPFEKATGMILQDGTLHLYARAEELRAAMVKAGTHWSQVAWLHGVEFHPAPAVTQEAHYQFVGRVDRTQGNQEKQA